MYSINKVVLVIILTGSVFLTSCKEDNKNEINDSLEKEMAGGNHKLHAMSEKNHNDDKSGASSEVQTSQESTVKFKNEQVAALYEHYINIKRALVKSNSELAKSSAKEFLAVAKHDAEPQLISSVQKIAGSNNVQEQRIAFSQLSKAIDGLLRNEIVSGTIYKQHCPMAFNNTGDSWFSTSKEIRNPYFGEKMLNCGRVEDVLN